MISMIDLKEDYLSIKKEIDSAVSRVLNSGWFVLGKEAESFESEFAKYCNAKYGVGVGSGTEALHLALWALGIKKGDEVLTVPNTAVPTVCAIDLLGAKPVFVDIDPDSYCIDVSKIESKISKNTKAIIPVHLFGNACEMDSILGIAKKHNLFVIEDACQAHGALYKGKKVGALADAGCFSFYPTKNLGCYGDGGMAVTNNKEIAEKIKQLRNYGQKNRYEHSIRGTNSRLDEMQAAVLKVKLKHLDDWNNKRKQFTKLYTSLLKDAAVTPKEKDHYSSCRHLYVIRHKKRDLLKSYLADNGVETQIHYPMAIYLQEAYKSLGIKKGECPIAEKYSDEILSLPLYPQIGEERVKKVAQLIQTFQ
ncbi:MAG: pyridoxal phosphate-dependent protein [Candidatus Saganbacteria bacterium]|uniref:Pyridoxal phosphate-dependent protein n=1 Tax=Candidatus Saganbacteria bacterium TaxID=2575572 RepID=A0A833KZR9_UNCSA|nr:MAG: pyridoxal phosphate-dependent protein [Candidatus Saganbacteria bacterium]